MPIDFTLSTVQRQLVLDARKFAQGELSRLHLATTTIPTPLDRFIATRPVYEQMVAAGFLRRIIPAPYGGEASGLVDLALIAEEFYAANASVSLTLFGSVLGMLPIFGAGTPEQVERLLKPFLATTGAPLAAFAFSEPDGSANAGASPPGAGLQTRAEVTDGTWRIHGAKKWVSSATGWDGNGADLLTVVCRTEPDLPPRQGCSIIALERGDGGGIILDEVIDAIGHRDHLVPSFRLDGASAPAANIIGRRGDGLAIAEQAFVGTGALVGIFGVALMRAAFDEALQFCRTQTRGGAVAIIEHPAVGYALADAKGAIEAARYLAWKACHALDTQAPGAAEAAVHAKVFGSETAVRVICDLMKVVGIESYGSAFPFGRLLQDALVLPIFDGGNLGVRRRQLHAMIAQPEYHSCDIAGTRS